jgi:hypothetical protein
MILFVAAALCTIFFLPYVVYRLFVGAPQLWMLIPITIILLAVLVVALYAYEDRRSRRSLGW